VAASGYASALLPSLPAGSVVALSRAARTVKVKVSRDGVLYGESLVLREVAHNGEPGALLHHGHIGEDGLDVPVSDGIRLAIMSGVRPRARVLASGSPLLDAKQGVLLLALPPSSRIQLEGCPSNHPNIAAKSADGDVIGGVRSHGRLEFLGLFPGEYKVGPVEVLRVGGSSAAVVSIEVGSGTVHTLGWNSLWLVADGVQGVVRLSSGDLIPEGYLRVLPWAGDLPRAGPATLALAVPVASDGVFATRSVSQAFDRLGVYSFMAGGVPVLLGEYSALQRQLLVGARHVRVCLQDDRPRAAHLLVVAPVKRDGRSAGQWRLSCSTNQTVDLGLVPDDILSVKLIAGSGVHEIALPAAGGVVAVPLAK
jgi:hypothetical protein